MSKDKLLEFLNKDNIADDIDHDELMKIGDRVQLGYKEDLSSSAEWLADVKKVEELSTLASKKKNTPLPNSANIKFPLITKACTEFASRVYPEIIKDGSVVKGRIVGRDFSGEKADRLKKVTDYMNWQLLWENDSWELELDRLLNRLALIGFICKKTYYDPVSKLIKSELCEPQDLIISADVKNLDEARRVTHVIHLHLNDLIEGARAGIYSEEEVDKLIEIHSKDELDPVIDILEQHTFLDLDEDSYAEPYIVTVVKESNAVLRIIPRFNKEGIKVKNKEVSLIIPIQCFTDYHFLVSPRGKFQSVGMGSLLLHLNETVNTLMNQLVDAGQLANLRGGFMDAKLKGAGTDGTRHDPGEFKYIKTMGGMNLKDGILPLDFKEPSSVLFQLMVSLIEASRDLASSNDVNTGKSNPSNSKTGATQALIQEGLKTFTAVQRRIYRSLSNELYKIFILNGIYLDPEKASKVIDQEITLKDFDVESVDILPVADPNLSTETQRAQKTQILIAIQQLPGVDPMKVTQRILKEQGIDKPEELLIDQEKQPANPEVIKIQAEIEHNANELQLKDKELNLKAKELQLQEYKTHCEILKMKADAILSLAKAESLHVTDQMSLYMKQLDVLSAAMDHQMTGNSQQHDATMQASDQAHQAFMQQQQQSHEQQMQQQQQAADQAAVAPDAQQS